MNPVPAEVHILIDDDGSVQVEVHGVKGDSCVGLSKPYTSLFGDVQITVKDEYHQATQSTRERQKL
jgi:hypothetical protein